MPATYDSGQTTTEETPCDADKKPIVQKIINVSNDNLNKFYTLEKVSSMSDFNSRFSRDTDPTAAFPEHIDQYMPFSKDIDYLNRCCPNIGGPDPVELGGVEGDQELLREWEKMILGKRILTDNDKELLRVCCPTCDFKNYGNPDPADPSKPNVTFYKGSCTNKIDIVNNIINRHNLNLQTYYLANKIKSYQEFESDPLVNDKTTDYSALVIPVLDMSYLDNCCAEFDLKTLADRKILTSTEIASLKKCCPTCDFSYTGKYYKEPVVVYVPGKVVIIGGEQSLKSDWDKALSNLSLTLIIGIIILCLCSMFSSMLMK